jgi:cell division protein FtsB
MILTSKKRRFLQNALLYLGAMSLIAYFAFHTYFGENGLQAQKETQLVIVGLKQDLQKLRYEREAYEHRISLLQNDKLDPDMLDERARRVLNYAAPKEVVIMVKP